MNMQSFLTAPSYHQGKKLIGIPDNFSQGIPDDPANICPVFPAPAAFGLMLKIYVKSTR
jgi:hypothetical protein